MCPCCLVRQMWAFECISPCGSTDRLFSLRDLQAFCNLLLDSKFPTLLAWTPAFLTAPLTIDTAGYVSFHSSCHLNLGSIFLSPVTLTLSDTSELPLHPPAQESACKLLLFTEGNFKSQGTPGPQWIGCCSALHSSLPLSYILLFFQMELGAVFVCF